MILMRVQAVVDTRRDCFYALQAGTSQLGGGWRHFYSYIYLTLLARAGGRPTKHKERAFHPVLSTLCPHIVLVLVNKR